MEDKKLLDLALEAGKIMVASGAETHRVEDTMERILSVKKDTQPEVFVISTGIFAGINDNMIGTRTKFKRITSRSIHLEKISRVNSMSRNFVSGKITIDEAFLELETIHALKGYPPFVIAFNYGLACAAFTLMFYGNFLEAMAAFAVGILLGVAVKVMEHHHVSYFLSCLFGGILIAVLSLCIHEFLNSLRYESMIIGSLMPLVPGVAITNAIRDIMEGDFLSGTARILEAILVAVAIATGVGVILKLYVSLLGGI